MSRSTKNTEPKAPRGAPSESQEKKPLTTSVLQGVPIATAASRKREIEQAVVRCQQGDAAAFQHIFREHVAGVHRHMNLLMGPDADLEDLVQLVFLNVFKSIGRFRGQSAFSTWLFRITVNVARQEIRVRGRVRRLKTAVSDVEKTRPKKEAKTPERELLTRQQIYRSLDKLSWKKRETFILYCYEGYSLDEISGLLDSTISTIGSRLQAARREIMAVIEAERKR